MFKMVSYKLISKLENRKFFQVIKKNERINNKILYSFKLRINKKDNGFENLDGLKILHISDTHFQDLNYLKKDYMSFLNKLKDIEFDIIIHTGDIVDKKNSSKKLNLEFKSFLGKLKSKYGKFYVFGNHDLVGDYSNLELEMNKLGFKNLTNSNLRLELNSNSINLVGLDDNLNGVPNIKKAIRGINKSETNILITHNLDALNKRYLDYFNLVFSGHLHAGELNFIFFDGVDYLKLKGHYKNIYNQKKGFKLLDNTISFIHYGGFSSIFEKSFFNRFLTKKAGIVIMDISISN